MKSIRIYLMLGLALSLLLGPVLAGAAQAQEQVVHVVQPGENLFRISLRYGVTMNAIMAANGLTDPNLIYVGQQLIIPSPTATPTPATEPTTGYTYTVARGDSLSAIAVRHGVSLWALIQANNLASPYIIYPGQELTIPDPTGGLPRPTPEPSQPAATPEPAAATEPAAPDTYTVQPGDTLFRIAQRFGTTVAALAHLNGIANPSTIYVGQVLRLSGPAPAAPGSGKRIVVDLSEQHLYAYQDGGLLYSFVASTGAAPTYTRAGQFYVQSKIPSAYGATWDIWMPHWLGIYWAGGSENGIHALPILSNGQTLWAGYLGTPISYGCVVLGTYEAQLLYEWAEIGTPVLIQP